MGANGSPRTVATWTISHANPSTRSHAEHVPLFQPIEELGSEPLSSWPLIPVSCRFRGRHSRRILPAVSHSFDLLLSVTLGIGLAAATGFRVFIPLLVAGLAARAGWVPLTESFAWLQSTPSLNHTFGTAAGLETLAFYIPGLDHLLDVLAGPLAVVAGILASVSVMVDVPPEIRWPIAVIAGGGIAALTKGTSAVIRAKTAAMTGGLGNPVVSTVETAGAATVSILAIVAPLLCLLGAIVIVVLAIRRLRRLR